MISLGKIVKVRGIGGEVVVNPSLDSSLHDIKEGETFLLKSEKYQKPIKIEYLKKIKGFLILKFVNINTINEAIKIVGYSVYGSGDPNSNDNVDDNEIIGFIVKDKKGETWGMVSSIEVNRLNKCLEIQNRNNTYDVPFVDEIVKVIDKKKKLIIIDPPEGLKELNKK